MERRSSAMNEKRPCVAISQEKHSMTGEKVVFDEDTRPSNGAVSAYGQSQRRPLIDYCNNDWKHNPVYRDPPPPRTIVDRFEDRMDDVFDCCIACVQSRKVRRWTLGLLLGISIFVFLWFTKISAYLEERNAILASLNDYSGRAASGYFGTNRRPQFPGMTYIETLDPALLPRGSSSRGGSTFRRRLIFIGDIHGCKTELVTLLKAINYNRDTDHIITTGDMINKGPDSLGVIDFLIENDASCVRGNHEDRVVLMAERMNSPLHSNKDDEIQSTGAIEEQAYSDADAKDRKLARSLSQKQLEFLKSCPVILRIGDVKALAGSVVVVHAGLVPGLSLENQDPSSVMNMRIVDLKTHVPSKDHEQKGSLPWTRLWNGYQKLLPSQRTMFPSKDPEEQKLKEMHTTVIYGHDSRRGLQIKQYTKGLDTGCAKGGKLTALVMTDGGKQELMQVKCKEYW